VGGATKKKTESPAEQEAEIELVRLSNEQGLSLTGPGGLLRQLTKDGARDLPERGDDEHLGSETPDPSGAGTGNIRNGTRSQAGADSGLGQVEIDVP
jgi:putative transposase